MKIVHLELSEANEFVAAHHRHHKPVVGHRFSLGAVRNGCELVGVAICGRPVSRGVNSRTTIEVTRLCTDGTKNVCSFLYGACARASKALGYDKIQTYILIDEPGTTLKAAGWVQEKITAGGSWDSYKRKGTRRRDQPTEPKSRWAKKLGSTREDLEWLL